MSTTPSPLPNWRDSVLTQLKERDAREKAPFETIINSHVALWNANQTLIRQRDKLRTANSNVSASGTSVTSSSGTPPSAQPSSSTSADGSQFSAPSAANTKELERKLERLQAELTATYKKEAKEATSQLALEAELRQLQSNEQTTKAAMERLRIKLKETQALLEEEQRSGGRAREEAATLRDELIRVRRLLELSEGKNRQLAKDNANLLERILSEKLKMADELNQMSQMYEDLQTRMKRKDSETAEKKDETAQQSEAQEEEESATKDVAGLVKGGVKRTQTTTGMDAKGPTMALDSAENGGSDSSDALPSLGTRFQAHDSEIPMIRYDETGTRLYTCSCDGTIKMWDAWTGALQKTLRSPVDVQLMGMDVKQKVVIGTGSDRTVRVWSLDNERVVHTLTGHASKLYACRLTLDAKTAVTGGTDRKVMTWDVVTGNRLRMISCSSIVNAVAVSEDGSYIATGHQDTSVRMWDIRTGKMALAVTDCHTNTVTSVEFTRSGKILTNSRDNTLSLIDLVAGKTEMRFSDMSYKSAYNWSSSDSSPSGSHVGAGGANGGVFLWSTTKAGQGLTKATATLEHSDKRVAAFAFNPAGGGRCATADESGSVMLWKSKKA